MENGVFITKQGKINFVDLAGSEMTKKTHSEGKTLEEANNINKSLMVLGMSILPLILVNFILTCSGEKLVELHRFYRTLFIFLAKTCSFSF